MMIFVAFFGWRDGRCRLHTSVAHFRTLFSLTHSINHSFACHLTHNPLIQRTQRSKSIKFVYLCICINKQILVKVNGGVLVDFFEREDDGTRHAVAAVGWVTAWDASLVSGGVGEAMGELGPTGAFYFFPNFGLLYPLLMTMSSPQNHLPCFVSSA